MLHGINVDSPAHQRLREGYAKRWVHMGVAADVDRNHAVDLSEWLAYWDEVLADDKRFDAEVATLEERFFEIFDTDEDGVIGPDEFCNFFSCHGLSAAMARQIFLDLDANGDGVVSHQELMEMAREFYRGNDPDAPGNFLFGPLGA
jgi:Ca2+-binding EF-hand superfamily protein